MHNFIDFFSLEQESEAVYACNENLTNAEYFLMLEQICKFLSLLY